MNKAILQIVCLVSVFLVVAINVIAAHAYEFVYCNNEVTDTTITYPEGTTCELTDDDLMEDEEREDEKEHANEE